MGLRRAAKPEVRQSPTTGHAAVDSHRVSGRRSRAYARTAVAAYNAAAVASAAVPVPLASSA